MNYPISFLYEDDIREKRRQQQLEIAGKGPSDRIGMKQIPNPVKYLYPDATLKQYRLLIGNPIATTKEVDICSSCYFTLSKYHHASGQNTHLILDYLNPPPKGTRKLYPDITFSKVARRKHLSGNTTMFRGDISEDSSFDKGGTQPRRNHRSGSDVRNIDLASETLMFSPKLKQDDWARNLQAEANRDTKPSQVLLRLLPSDNLAGGNSSKKESNDDPKTPTLFRQNRSIQRSPSSSIQLEGLQRKDSQLSLERNHSKTHLLLDKNDRLQNMGTSNRGGSISKAASEGKNGRGEDSRRSSLFNPNLPSRLNLELTMKQYELEKIDSEVKTTPSTAKMGRNMAYNSGVRQELQQISTKRERLRSMLASHGLSIVDSAATNPPASFSILKRRPQKSFHLSSASTAADRDRTIDKLYGIK